MSSIEDFMAWQAEDVENRRVNIKINPKLTYDTSPASYVQDVSIWVSSDKIQNSLQYVENVEDIDLEGTARIYDMAEKERILAKYRDMKTEG